MIEKIPVKAIKHQAMMQQFANKETMLAPMENISLFHDQKHSSKNSKQPITKDENKSGGSTKKNEDCSEV